MEPWREKVNKYLHLSQNILSLYLQTQRIDLQAQQMLAKLFNFVDVKCIVKVVLPPKYDIKFSSFDGFLCPQNQNP